MIVVAIMSCSYNEKIKCGDEKMNNQKTNNLELHVTLWPDNIQFPHFARFANDERLSGIRLNSSMTTPAELPSVFANKPAGTVPLYFDVKGRQLRIKDFERVDDHLELIVNHPLSVDTPTVVLFKAGEDRALLKRVEGGTRLIFQGGPRYKLKAGESIHIRNSSYKMHGPILLPHEKENIEIAKRAGITRFLMSYVESQRDIDELSECVPGCEIIGKIESKKGLEYVRNDFKKRESLSLMCARGDLYLELDKPHEICAATKLIVEKDPEAMLGSRMLLTTLEKVALVIPPNELYADGATNHDVLRMLRQNTEKDPKYFHALQKSYTTVPKPLPECSDFSELAWLYDIGYRKMMFCDGLCLREEALGRAITIFEHFAKDYAGVELRKK